MNHLLTTASSADMCPSTPDQEMTALLRSYTLYYLFRGSLMKHMATVPQML